MQARIYKPAKNAMQSGNANARKWHLEFTYDGSRNIEPVMGWTSSSDTNQEVTLTFDKKSEAVNFAEENKLDYTIYPDKPQKLEIKSYADNFKA